MKGVSAARALFSETFFLNSKCRFDRDSQKPRLKYLGRKHELCNRSQSAAIRQSKLSAGKAWSLTSERKEQNLFKEANLTFLCSLRFPELGEQLI
jgi:hypothetical protein